MKTVRRLTANVMASVDWIIGQFENHEALVTAAIREVEETSARARAQHKRVIHDGQVLRKRLIQLREGVETWKTRAIKTASLDEAKALECLRRKERLEKEIAELEQQEREHTRLERQLAKDLTNIEERLKQLRAERNLMRTREARAQALAALKEHDSLAISELDDLFERWEGRITEYELRAECAIGVHDELESSFEEIEQDEALRERLQELLAVQRSE